MTKTSSKIADDPMIDAGKIAATIYWAGVATVTIGLWAMYGTAASFLSVGVSLVLFTILKVRFSLDRAAMLGQEYRIAKLDVGSGDVLVAKFDDLISMETRRKATDDLRRFVPPGSRVLVIGKDIELSVLTAAEIAERTST
jgi:hypothetical protein